MNARAIPAGKPVPISRRAGHPLRRMPPARGRMPPWWPWFKLGFTIAFFVLVAFLLVRHARTVDWPEVFAAIRAYPWPVLAAAAVLAASSHLLYSTYDLLGRHYTGHGLATATVMKVTFISYAFNLNLGSLVGGVAFRYRLYSRLGLTGAQVTHVLSLSMLTNWLGYLVLAGTVFTFWPLALPPTWKVGGGSLQVLGMLLLGTAAAYVALCAVSTRRAWTVRGHELSLPSLPVALLQIAMSGANWLLIAGVVYVLLPERIDFPDVLSVLLIAAVAGVITHVPAGLGVLEAVFVALLSQQAPEGRLLAALLTYRAVYYLAPFAIALLAYLVAEARRPAGDKA